MTELGRTIGWESGEPWGNGRAGRGLPPVDHRQVVLKDFRRACSQRRELRANGGLTLQNAGRISIEVSYPGPDSTDIGFGGGREIPVASQPIPLPVRKDGLGPSGQEAEVNLAQEDKVVGAKSGKRRRGRLPNVLAVAGILGLASLPLAACVPIEARAEDKNTMPDEPAKEPTTPDDVFNYDFQVPEATEPDAPGERDGGRSSFGDVFRQPPVTSEPNGDLEQPTQAEGATGGVSVEEEQVVVSTQAAEEEAENPQEDRGAEQTVEQEEPEEDPLDGVPDKSELKLKNDVQDLSLSCESSAAGTIAEQLLGAAPDGYGSWEEYFYMNMPKDRNPHNGFRGRQDGNMSPCCEDYGVYGEVMVKMFQELGLDAEVIYSESDDEAYRRLVEKISQGYYPMVWMVGPVGMNSQPVYEVDPRTGEQFVLHFGQHVLVPHGYEVIDRVNGKYRILVSDPYTNRSTWVDVIDKWGVFRWMTVIVRNWLEPEADSMKGLD